MSNQSSTTPSTARHDNNHDTITIVGVIGAGQMGRGIAQVFAAAGFKVTLQDTNGAAIALAKKEIMASLQKLQEKKLLATSPLEVMARIVFCEDLKELKYCQLVVEAIVEDLSVKKNLYNDLKTILRNCPMTILASNTSALSIKTLQEYSPHPENFLGIHFMNPAPLMPLVEIITTATTNAAHGQAMKDIVEKKLMKQAVVLKDSPGFVLNRLLVPYLNEAVKLLAAGIASREDIDKAMMLGAGYKMGPLALLDFIGLDTCHSILRSLAEGTGQDHYQPAPMLSDMVQQGHLGRKTKKGFYDY